MVVGQHGLHGLCVMHRVMVELLSDQDPALCHLRAMVERDVKERVWRRKSATSILAQVGWNVTPGKLTV